MGATPTDLRITDIVPIDDSGESDQNSEPSLAVDPLDPTQMIAGAFADGSPQPFYKSTDGGTTWSDYGTIVLTDKSIAWLTDGSAALTATVFGSANIKIHSGTTADTHFSPPTTQPTPDEADQPWIVTGPADHVYVGYNDDSTTAAFTASVLVSTDGGVSFSNVVLDRANPLGDQPSIRLAVNGSTAYAVFVRENSLLDNPYSGPNGKDFRYNSSFVIVRSDDGGADGFTALGANGNGVTIASPISVFAEDPDSPLTLGQNAAGAEIAIAVDPNNAAHVVVAYGDATGAGNSTPSDLQLVVAESTDGGADWTTKFISSSLTRSGDPGLAILQDGEIGLLYDNYDPATDELSQHLLTTTDDFATTHDLVLGTETNKTPGNVFEPYLGDFFNLTSIGDTFYGVFSASNQDDGIHGQLNGATTFQRDYNGTPDTATFQLTDLSGSPVGASIDPFFFELQAGSTAPFDVDGDTVSDLVFQNNGTPQIWLWNGTAVTSQTTFSDPGPSWRIVTSADAHAGPLADERDEPERGSWPAQSRIRLATRLDRSLHTERTGRPAIPEQHQLRDDALGNERHQRRCHAQPAQPGRWMAVGERPSVRDGVTTAQR